MPFSKFDPYKAVEPASEGSTPAAARRARILRWVNWIVLVYTAFGFGMIVYWLVKAN